MDEKRTRREKGLAKKELSIKISRAILWRSFRLAALPETCRLNGNKSAFDHSARTAPESGGKFHRWWKYVPATVIEYLTGKTSLTAVEMLKRIFDVQTPRGATRRWGRKEAIKS